MEWGKVIDGKPIRVNTLCPGNIITPMVEKNFKDDPSLKKKWENGNMLGRLSEAKEYRGAALFALSDASSFMTGSSLIVDGGYSAVSLLLSFVPMLWQSCAWSGRTGLFFLRHLARQTKHSFVAMEQAYDQVRVT